VIELTSTNGYAWYVAAANRITSGAAAVKTRSWQHLAVSRSSGVTKMFIDGLQVGSNYTDTNNYPAGSLTIGRANDGVNTRNFTGYLSGLRVIKGQALYTANTSPPTLPPTSTPNTVLLLTGTNGGINDASGRNNIETLNETEIYTGVKRYGNASMYFDGTGDRLTVNGITNSGIFNQLTSSGRTNTIEMWIYPLALTSGGARSFIVGSWAGSAGWTYDLTSGGDIFITTNGAGSSISLSSKITINTWQHLAFVNDNTNLKVYRNGVNVGSLAYQAPTSYIGPLSIGERSDGTLPFIGYIDDLRITTGSARYTANFTAPTAAFKTN
jgi:hypothetical protein